MRSSWKHVAPLTPKQRSLTEHVSQLWLQAEQAGWDEAGIIRQPSVSNGVSPAELHGPISLCVLLTR